MPVLFWSSRHVNKKGDSQFMAPRFVIGHGLLLTEVDGLRVCWGYTGGAGLCGQVGDCGSNQASPPCAMCGNSPKRVKKRLEFSPEVALRHLRSCWRFLNVSPRRSSRFEVYPLGRKPWGLYHVQECRITTSTVALTFRRFLLEEQEETAGKRKVRVSLLQHLHKDEQEMEGEGREDKIFISPIFPLFLGCCCCFFPKKRDQTQHFF